MSRRTLAGGRLSVPRQAPSPVESAGLAPGQVEWHQTLRRSRIDMMLLYAERRNCRGRALLAYFGEQMGDACGHGDCAAGTAGKAAGGRR